MRFELSLKNKTRTNKATSYNIQYLTTTAYLHQHNFDMKFLQEGGAASRVASHSDTSSPYMHRQMALIAQRIGTTDQSLE
jgi:hypothetical protein